MAPKVRMRPMAKAAGPGGALRRPAAAPAVGGRGALRRPAGADAPGLEAVEARWNRGDAVQLQGMSYALLLDAGPIVVEEASYYHQPCKAAGSCLGVSRLEGRDYLRLKLSGTLCEALLKHHTGHPSGEIRGHVCPADCSQEEVAEDLIHIRTLRKMKRESEEDAWVQNLEKVLPMEHDVDELEVLRKKAKEVPQGRKEAKEKERDRKERKGSLDSGSEGKKAKDKKDVKKKKKKKRRSSSSRRSDLDRVKVDGTQSKRAAQKETQALFAGTGLDCKDKVRNRVARLGRRHLKRKSDKTSSSNSDTSSEKSSRSQREEVEEDLFSSGSKVRILAEKFPGALTNHAITQMRGTLLQEIGHQDRPNTLCPVAVAYCRQHLLKKATGPMQRELLTLTHALDQVLRGRAASAADTLTQRVKSIEQTLLGSHWTVAQRLEVLPQDSASITALPEAREAQREVYSEARLRWLSSAADGRQPQKGGKGGGKSQGKDPGRASDREAKGGKKSGGKGDSAKKKDS